MKNNTIAILHRVALAIALLALAACAPSAGGLFAHGPNAPNGTSGGQKLGSVIIPQQAGDFWVSNTAVSPFAIKDGSSVTRDTFETVHGRITAGNGGTDWLAAFGPVVGSETSRAGIYLLPNATALSGANPTIQYISGNGLASQLQSNSDLFSWSAPAGTLGALGTTALYVGGSSSAAPVRLDYTTATTPLLQSGTNATSLTVGTNKSLATLALQFGAAATALSLDPTNGDAFKDSGGVTRDSIELGHGRLTVGGGSTDRSVILGPLPTLETSWSGIHLLPNATAASSTNWSLRSDGTSTLEFNVPTSGTYQWWVNGSVFGTLYNPLGSVGSLVLGNVVGSSSNYAIQGDGSSYTAVNAPGAAGLIEFAINNAAVPLILAGGTQNGVALGANSATVGHMRSPPGFQWLARNSANTGNNSVLYDDGADSIYLSNSGYANAFVNGATQSGLMGAGTVHVYAVNGGAVIGNSITHADANAVNGSITFQTRSISGALTIDTTTTDSFIIVDTSGGAVNVTLPTPTAGRWLTIVDKKNTFGTNACTLVRHAAEKIDGTAASKVISSNGFRGYIISDGTDWYTQNVSGMRPPALAGALLALGLFIARRRRADNETLQEVA